jgi:hypothetical protein
MCSYFFAATSLTVSLVRVFANTYPFTPIMFFSQLFRVTPMTNAELRAIMQSIIGFTISLWCPFSVLMYSQHAQNMGHVSSLPSE